MLSHTTYLIVATSSNAPYNTLSHHPSPPLTPSNAPYNTFSRHPSPPHTPSKVTEMAAHLNVMNRRSKAAQMDCQQVKLLTTYSFMTHLVFLL